MNKRKKVILECWLIFGGLLALSGPSIVQSYYDHKLISIDGAFQTYVMLAAVSAGREVGLDFYPYLGPLLGYIMYPLFYLFGSTLGSSTASAIIFSSGLFIFSIWYICFIYIKDFNERIVIFLGIISIFLAAGLGGSYGVRSLFTPGFSLRAIRWSLPYMHAALMFLSYLAIEKQFRMRNFDEITTRLCLSVVWGLLAGFHIFWAPDVGFVSFAVAFVTFCIFYLVTYGLDRTYIIALWLMGGGISAALVGKVMLGVHFVSWFDYLFKGVGSDQFWFFGPWAEATRVYSLTDIFAKILTGLYSSFIIFGAVIFGMTAVKLLKFPQGIKENVKKISGIYIFLTLCAAGITPQIGGIVDDPYAVALVVPTTSVIIIYIVRDLLVGIGHFNRFIYRPVISLAPYIAFVIPVLGIFPTVYLVYAKDTTRVAYVEELGVWVSKEESDVVEAMRKFNDESNKVGLGPKARIFSNYVSYVDIIGGAMPPSPYGMTIHALGSVARERHLAAFNKESYPLITTISPDFNEYANWQARASGYLYKEIITKYEPWARGKQHIFWRPRLRPIETQTSGAACSATKINAYSIELRVQDDIAGKIEGGVYFAQLDVDLELTLKAGWEPLIGSRSLITATEIQSGLSPEANVVPTITYVHAPFWRRVIRLPTASEPDNSRTYGIGQKGGTKTIYFDHRIGQETIIRVEAQPRDRVRLSADTCRSFLIAPQVDARALGAMSGKEAFSTRRDL